MIDSKTFSLVSALDGKKVSQKLDLLIILAMWPIFKNEIIEVVRLLENEKWFVFGGYTIYLQNINHNPKDIDIITTLEGLTNLKTKIGKYSNEKGDNWIGITFKLGDVEFEVITEESSDLQYYQEFLENSEYIFITLTTADGIQIPCLSLLKQAQGYYNVYCDGKGSQDPMIKIKLIANFLNLDPNKFFESLEREYKIKKIKYYINKGLSYEQIGKILNISRARVHQLYKKYYPKRINNNLKKIVFASDNMQCQWHNICRDKKVLRSDLVIHHLDGDNTNNNLDNLVTLCRFCSAAFNKIRDKGYKEYICDICQKKYNLKEGKLIKDKFICKSCIEVRKNKKNIYWCEKYKLSKCVICGENKIRHFGNGLCRRCYGKLRFSDTENKIKHKESMRKWRIKNLEKIKSKQRKYHKKYYSKNREMLLRQQKERMQDIKLNDPIKYKELKEKWTLYNKNKSKLAH